MRFCVSVPSKNQLFLDQRVNSANLAFPYVNLLRVSYLTIYYLSHLQNFFGIVIFLSKCNSFLTYDSSFDFSIELHSNKSKLAPISYLPIYYHPSKYHIINPSPHREITSTIFTQKRIAFGFS